MKTLVSRLFLFTLLSSALFSSSQEDPELGFVVKKGNKTYTFEKFDYICIFQHVSKFGEKTLLKIKADSLVKHGDTLTVRPWRIREKKYMANYRVVSNTYPRDSVLKIPVSEITEIKIKRQPFCIILSTIAAVSYIGAFTAIFAIPPNSEEQINRRTEIALGFFKVFIPTFTVRVLFAKKHLHFDKTKTPFKPWTF